jgi:hypothetical protein
VAIECEGNCRYLLESRRQAFKKLLNFYGDSEFESRWFELLHNLRLALVQVKLQRAPNMTDAEAITALANVVESRRLQEKGLIYGYRSVNPSVQEATAALLKVISQYENQKTKVSSHFDSAELNNCLKYLLRQAQTTQTKGANFIQLTSACVGTKFTNINNLLTGLREEVK